MVGTVIPLITLEELNFIWGTSIENQDAATDIVMLLPQS